MWEIWLHWATVKKNTHHLIDQYHSIRIYGLINLLSQMDGNYCLLHSRFPSETFLQNWTPFIISHLYFSFYLTALSWVATSFNVSFSCQISSKFLTILFFSEPPVLQVKYSVGYTSIHICEIVNKFSINFVPGHLMRALSIACMCQNLHFLKLIKAYQDNVGLFTVDTKMYICVYLKQQHKEILLSCTLISFFF